MIRFILGALALVGLAGVAHAETITVTPPEGSEFAQIHTEQMAEDLKVLETGTPDAAKRLMEKIIKEPGKTPSIELMAMGDRMVRDGNVDDGLFWFHAGRMRVRYDVRRCTDRSLADTVVVLSMRWRAPLEAGFKDTAKARAAIQKMVEWDAKTPYDYDFRWVALHGMGAMNAALTGKAGAESIAKPEGEWAGIHKTNVEEYQKAMEMNLAEVDKAGGYEAFKKQKEDENKAFIEKLKKAGEEHRAQKGK